MINLVKAKKKSSLIRFITLLNKEDASVVDHELPFAMMLFSLMATGGMSIYEGWKRLKFVKLFQRFRKMLKTLCAKSRSWVTIH